MPFWAFNDRLTLAEVFRLTRRTPGLSARGSFVYGESAGYLPRGTLSEACQLFGIAQDTAKQAVRVCRAFERCVRTHELSFDHHARVANDEDASELLAWAVEHKAEAVFQHAGIPVIGIPISAAKASGWHEPSRNKRTDETRKSSIFGWLVIRIKIL